jgi:hypothetical protein
MSTLSASQVSDMASNIEMIESAVDPEELPPIFRQTSQGSRVRSYRSVPLGENQGPAVESLFSQTWLNSAMNFVGNHKTNFLVASQTLLLVLSLTTLAIASVHFQGGNLLTVQCGEGDNETCTIDLSSLRASPSSQIDPDDFDAVALSELSRKDLYRTIRRAVRESFLKPDHSNVSLAQALSYNLKQAFFEPRGNDSALFQTLVRDLTVHLETLQHPESTGKRKG